MMTQAELDREIDRLDREGKRHEVIALMRKYGIFTDEAMVTEYLDKSLD